MSRDYTRNIELEWENLPNWIIKDLKETFGRTSWGGENFNPSKWISGQSSYLSTITRGLQIPYLRKGIEYAQKCLEIHKPECSYKGKTICPDEESWLRRIALSETLLEELIPPHTEFETAAYSPPVISSFRFSGKKIDLIRILNALYELRRIQTEKGQIPTKLSFMQGAGAFFGVDLSDYDTHLSQAIKEGKLESNLKIFEELKGVTQKIFTEKTG